MLRSNDSDALVANRLDVLKRKLLDLGLRNKLLNYKHAERGKNYIRVVDELPQVICARLMSAKRYSFASVPYPDQHPADEESREFREALARKLEEQPFATELRNERAGRRYVIERRARDEVRRASNMAPYVKPTAPQRARALGISTDHDLPQPSEKVPRKHTDSSIQTLFYDDELTARLAKLRDSARTMSEDAGIEALYCAFGFLEWYESPASTVPLYAPLVFVPVIINRELRDGIYVYEMSARDDELEPNITLAQKLRQDYRAELPECHEAEGLEAYFRQVEALLQKGDARWKVRRQVTIGLFTFAKLALYKDLTSSEWPSTSRLTQHPTVRALLGNSDEDQANASLHAPDEHVDTPQMQQLVRVLVTDADVSQQNAIADVMRGKNLVIQGPPGTGKSQTITNIIAAAMERGKTVLFVAEKMAALEVVKKRLDSFGLGEFCLELHAAKTKKSAVHEVFRARLEPAVVRDKTRATQLADEREQARQRISRYATIVNSIAGDTGHTYQQLAWRYLKASDALPGAAPLRISNALTITDAIYRESLSLARRLSELYAKAGTATATWRGVGARALDKLAEERVRAHLNAWRSAASQLDVAIDAFVSECAWATARTQASAQERVTEIALVPRPSSDVDHDVLAQLADTETRNTVRSYLELRNRAARAIDYLTPRINVAAANREALAQTIMAVEQLAIEGADAHQLAARLAHDGRRLEQWQRAVEFKRALQTFFGVLLDSASATQRAFAVAQSIAAADRSILQWRTSGLLAEDARPTLFALQQRCKKLRARRAALARDARIDGMPESRTLRAAAETLRTSSFWGRLFSAVYKSAQGLHRGLYAGVTKDRHVMAADLDALAAYHDDEVAFLDAPSLVGIAGKHANGLDTPFEQLADVVDWAEDTRSRTASGDDVDRALRTKAFEVTGADTSKLQRLLAHSSAQDFAAALEVLAKRPQATLETGVSQIERRLQRGRALLTQLQHAGVAPDVRFSDLPEVDRTLSELDALRAERQALVSDPTDASLLTRCDELDVETVAATVAYACALHEGATPRPVLRWMARVSIPTALRRLAEHARTINAGLVTLSAAQSAAVDLLKLDTATWLSAADPSRFELSALAGHIASSLNALNALWVACELGRVIDEAQATPLVEVAEALTSKGFSSAPAAFEVAFCRSALEELHEQHPDLNTFATPTLDHLRAQFAEADAGVIEAHREVVAATIESTEVPVGYGRGKVAEYTERALIVHELAKQSRLLALRPLFARAGRAAQALTPCFMMSPMSVAQYMQPGAVSFDLVIIDEASQMRPEDALGAVARGKQLVVVGDSKQLPPTSFFAAMRDDGEPDDDDATDGAESILDLASRAFTPGRQLRWHYRSRHESLIAFSNAAFYDHKLVVCPSSRPAGDKEGVSLEKVDGVYGGNTNQAEARAMMAALEKHVATHSDHSLALVTLNQPQRDLVQDMLDELCRTNGLVETYRARREQTLEPLVVKNLENVQGDERDVVFVSTVFGVTPDNKFALNFGPLNRQNGERRLNVLFTRAKHRLRVFTSIPFERIPDTASNGVRVLRDYLRFAQASSHEVAAYVATAAQSQFEIWFAQRLQAHGYTVQSQLGVEGFRLDLAIGHASRPGEFILALECDGATYHASKSARDRDRLRDERLHQLGWHTHRVWSADWISNPDRELARVLDRLATIVGGHTEPRASVKTAAAPVESNSVLVEEILGEIQDDSLREAVTELVRHGASTPVIPYELVDNNRGAELALEVGWPDRRVAIALPHESSAAERLRAMGWNVWMADKSLDLQAVSLALGLS